MLGLELFYFNLEPYFEWNLWKEAIKIAILSSP